MASYSLKLKNEIFKACDKSKFPAGETPRIFLLNGELERILTCEYVTRLLQCQDDDPLVQFVLNHAKKLFAISLMSQVHELNYMMELFMKHDISDRDLPLPTSEADFSNSLAQCFQLLDPMVRHDFINMRQWIFLAPVFPVGSASADALEPRPFAQGIIFPFIDAKKANGGGFGIVYKVKIHELHLDGRPDDAILKVRNVPNPTLILLYLLGATEIFRTTVWLL